VYVPVIFFVAAAASVHCDVSTLNAETAPVAELDAGAEADPALLLGLLEPLLDEQADRVVTAATRPSTATTRYLFEFDIAGREFNTRPLSNDMEN
jgi:hypothetical protein